MELAATSRIVWPKKKKNDEETGKIDSDPAFKNLNVVLPRSNYESC